MKWKSIVVLLLTVSVLVSCGKAPVESEGTTISIRSLPSEETTEAAVEDTNVATIESMMG